MIYLGTQEGAWLLAISATTGALLWKTQLESAASDPFALITSSPTVVGGTVYVGVASLEEGIAGFVPSYPCCKARGSVVAVQAHKGKIKWRTYTTPVGYSGGGVWGSNLPVDEKSGLVYVGTGNPQPWVEKFRGAQGLDNLYTCSILAVDLTTGQLKWHYQAVPNDNWDYDNVQQLMLLDLPIDGRTRKVITQAAKNGFFYVLDRVTGEFISAEPFVKVSWALGMSKDGRPIVNPKAYYDTNPISILPTSGGGHNWSPMSYNPGTGLVYIPAFYSSFPLQAQAEYKPGSTGYVRPRGDTRLVEPAYGPEPPAGARGGLQAWDPVTQKLRWNIAGGGGIGGGTATTAGNLVFQVINDGRFRAIAADKGDVLYEVQTNRTGMAPPITYEVDGTQYVAFAGGLGRPNSTFGATTDTVENAPMMFVFALDGTAALPPPPPPATEPAAAPENPAPEQRT